MQNDLKNFLEFKAYNMRRWSVISPSQAGSGHTSTCLSAADIMSVLFFYAMKYDPQYYDNPDNDRFILNGEHKDIKQQVRIKNFLDLIRERSDIHVKAEIISENNFPTGAGLASSASGFAALTLASCKAAGLELSKKEMSILARRGSGSAPRSIFGGFVEMNVGVCADGHDSYATQIADESFWPLHVLIVITSRDEKKMSSSQGMIQTARTSPFFEKWVNSSKSDLDKMRSAINDHNFEILGALSEHNCLKMHGLALSARPGIIYWNGVTVDVMNAVREMRRNNIPAYFTIDAGPQVKILCEPEHSKKVRAELGKIAGIKDILISELGQNAKILEDKN